MLKWLLVAMLGLLMGAFIVLQLPYVQNRLFEKLLQHLSHTTQFAITHQRFQLKWLSHASLTGLSIKDPQDSTLLAVDQLALQVNPLQLLIDRYITLKTVRIKGAQVQLRKEGEKGYTMNSLLQRLVGATTPAPDARHAAPLVIESMSLQDIEFSIDDQQFAPLKDAFDYKHLKIQQLHAELANLKAQASTLEVDIRYFTCKHADRPLFIDHFSTSLVIAPDSIQCKALNLRTGSSALRGSCTITYDSSAPLAAFNSHVHLTAHLDNTVVAAEELAIFLPYFKQHKTTYTLGGTFEGQVNDFHIKGLQLDFGEQGSHIKGCLSLQGLPNVQAARFNMEVKQGMLHTTDLLPYLDEKHYKLIEQFNLVKTQGHFYGTKDDFIAQATFDTDLGKLTTDLAFQNALAAKGARYKGAIAISDFELGRWLNNSTVQQLTMQGQIDGEGLSLATAHFQLEAHINKLGFNNYEYENLYTKGAFAQAFFQGQVTMDDPHLKFQADAALDLRGDPASMAIQGVLEKACLQALHLTDSPATLRTNLSIALQGLSLDEVKLDAQLYQFCWGLEGKEVHLDSLHICTDRGDFGRRLALDSELVALKAVGDFTYSTLASDLNQFLQGYQRRLMHSERPSQKYTLQPYTLAYQIHCKDINPLLRVFIADASVAPGAKLKGSFSQHEVATFSLHLAEVDSLAFRQNRWANTQFDLFATQSKDSQEVSATAQLFSKEQQWGTLNTTEDLALAISWENNQIDFSSTLGQKDSCNQVNLQAKAVLLDSTIELTLCPSTIKLSDNQWHVHPENRITLGQSWAQFQNFELSSGKQQVSLAGMLSADPNKVLHLKVKDFSLANLNLLVNKQLTGALNAAAVLQGILGGPRIESDVTLEKLTIDNFWVGDVHAQTNWNDALKRLGLACQVGYLKEQTVAIQGFYEPLKEENSLQLVANFSHAQLAALEPLVKDELSQLTGELRGTIYIHGSPAQPRITGEASITNAAVRIRYLNTCYHVNGELTFADQAINITTLALSDDQQGKAVLQGIVAHKGFKDFQIGLTGNMTHFKLLNTTSEDHAYFYGTSVLSGSFSLSGPANNMAVYMKTKTDPGTSIYISMSKASNTVTQERFIRFVNLKTKNQATQARQVAFKGFQLTLILEITPDAYTELTLNAASGDVIKGRGNGRMKIEIDPEGVLNMAGGFEFSAGEYSFSLYRLVNKTFKILPGSKITWYDSPYEGVLDIKVAYEQWATLAPLLKTIGGGAEAKKKYPVQVLIALQGVLVSPDISFKVNFPEYPSDLASQTAVRDFQEKAEEDEQYLTNQIVSLVIFKGFSNAKLTDTGSGMLSRNLSELVSQQLGSLVSILDENLEMDADIDLTELEREGLAGLRLKLTYSLFDGRLQVSREGGAGREDKSSIAQLVGEWTVTYLLTKDGSLRAKFYNKHIANPTYVGTNSAAALSGVFSLSYTKGFNQWWELFRGSKKAAKRASEEK